MVNKMVNFDFVVGQSYPVSNGVASAQLEFLGLVGNGARRVLLFDNPSLLGYPFPFIGATVDIIYPSSSSSTVTVQAILRARLGGQSATNLARLDINNTSWGSLP